MKKIVYTLAIVMAIVFIGVQNANSQVNVRVWWVASCPDTCTSTQVCAYEVAYEMYYICDHHQDLICTGNDTISCSYEEVVFPCNYECYDHTAELCYYIEATATKYCIGPPNGYLVKCTGRFSGFFTCDQIMDGPECQIEWEN